jgi:hypothetical protein
MDKYPNTGKPNRFDNILEVECLFSFGHHKLTPGDRYVVHEFDIVNDTFQLTDDDGDEITTRTDQFIPSAYRDRTN